MQNIGSCVQESMPFLITQNHCMAPVATVVEVPKVHRREPTGQHMKGVGISTTILVIAERLLRVYALLLSHRIDKAQLDKSLVSA